MAYIDDLVVGQIDPNDSIPLNYCTPKGYFVGAYFEGDDYQTAVYSREKVQVPKFTPANRVTTSHVFSKARDLILENYQSYNVPTEIDGNTLIGISHKLEQSEINNQMIAISDIGKLSLMDPNVAELIRKNHAFLKGTGIIKNGKIDYLAANRVIAVYDEQNNFYVFSLINGAKPEFVNRLFKLDVEMAFGIVSSAVKVPLNINQFTALLSLAFDIGHQKFITSKLLKLLNAGDYNCATYFMEFVEKPIKNGTGVSTILYNRRQAEISLFTAI